MAKKLGDIFEKFESDYLKKPNRIRKFLEINVKVIWERLQSEAGINGHI